jgi:hypothetical protein
MQIDEAIVWTKNLHANILACPLGKNLNDICVWHKEQTDILSELKQS